jgi:hypothetical protein
VVSEVVIASPAVVLLRANVAEDGVVPRPAVVSVPAKGVVGLLVGDIVVSRAAVYLIRAYAAMSSSSPPRPYKVSAP